jgi:hypothetical protein
MSVDALSLLWLTRLALSSFTEQNLSLQGTDLIGRLLSGRLAVCAVKQV